MLRHFFNDFMTFVPLQLPQLLDVTTMEEAQFYGDYALLTFPLRDPYDLEEVMDLFEDDMELITLYHHIPTHADKFGHSTCAYSNPAFGQMFKMNCKTDADGKVNSILVTLFFYESPVDHFGFSQEEDISDFRRWRTPDGSSVRFYPI